MSGDSCASGRLPRLTAPSESSHSSSLHSNSRHLPRIGSRSMASNNKYDQMTRFMTELAEDQFKDTGSGKSLGITKINIIPATPSIRHSTMGSVHGEYELEEKEERRRMNDVRDRMDYAKRKRERAGPGSSLGAIGDRFTLLSSSYGPGEGIGDSTERQKGFDEEDVEISTPHLVLRMERGANGQPRTVARDDRVSGRSYKAGKPEMNLPSFVRKQPRLTSTRSLTPPPDWLAPQLSLLAQSSRSDRPTKRRKPSIAHSVSSHEVPVGVSYSSPTRDYQEDRYHRDYPEDSFSEGRPLAESGHSSYLPMSDLYDPPPTESVYERQIDRIRHAPSFHPTPTFHDQDFYVDPSLPLPRAQDYQFQSPAPRFQNRQLSESIPHRYSSPLPPFPPQSEPGLCMTAGGQNRQLYLQERLENVVDDLTNFWKRTRDDQGLALDPSAFEQEDQDRFESNLDGMEQFVHESSAALPAFASETIYGQRLPLDPQIVPTPAAQESSFPFPLFSHSYDSQHFPPLPHASTLPKSIKFVSQIQSNESCPIFDAEPHDLPRGETTFARLSTPTINPPTVQSNHLLETPLHSIQPPDLFAHFDSDMIRSDDAEHDGVGGDEPIESEYELTYSQVPSDDSDYGGVDRDGGVDLEVENRPILPSSTPPTTLTSIELDVNIEEENDQLALVDVGGAKDGVGKGDIEPGWRRRRSVVVDEAIREEEEELLLLSEDLSIEEMEILAG